MPDGCTRAGPDPALQPRGRRIARSHRMSRPVDGSLSKYLHDLCIWRIISAHWPPSMNLPWGLELTGNVDVFEAEILKPLVQILNLCLRSTGLRSSEANSEQNLRHICSSFSWQSAQEMTLTQRVSGLWQQKQCSSTFRNQVPRICGNACEVHCDFFM